MIQFKSESVEETMQLGEKLARHAQADDCIVLSGDLGAGKTQFAKGFARGLGVADEITSPTFNILLEHVGDELPLLHFDLYRLDEDEDLESIDFFGLLESGGVSLVEWGDKFANSMPEERIDVHIAVDDDGARLVSMKGMGERGASIEGAFVLESDTAARD